MFFKLQIAVLVILTSTFTLAQQAPPKSAPARSASQPAAKAMPTQGAPNPAAKRKAFVLDVVRMAVAMPQPDPQDRLRVLSSAADVVAPVSKPVATRLAQQGAHLEAELISSGIKPAVSILAGGQVDCATAANFVEALPAIAVAKAEDSLLGAISTCPKQASEPARIKLESALQSGTLAARPLMALMEQVGPSSQWSQQQFAMLFASLPAEAEKFRSEAPNYAAMYSEIAPAVGKDVAQKAGVSFLEWLGKLQPGSERNLAVNIATELARRGRSVVLVDLEADMGASISPGVRPSDKHASIFELLRNERRPNEAVQPVPGVANLQLVAGSAALAGIDGALRNARQPERRLGDCIGPLAASVDDVVIDSPSNFTVLSLSVPSFAQHLVVPIRADKWVPPSSHDSGCNPIHGWRATLASCSRW